MFKNLLKTNICLLCKPQVAVYLFIHIMCDKSEQKILFKLAKTVSFSIANLLLFIGNIDIVNYDV